MIMLFEQEEAVRRYGRRMRKEGVEEGLVSIATTLKRETTRPTGKRLFEAFRLTL